MTQSFLQKYRVPIAVGIILAVIIGLVLYFIFKKKDTSPTPSPTLPISPFTRPPRTTTTPPRTTTTPPRTTTSPPRTTTSPPGTTTTPPGTTTSPPGTTTSPPGTTNTPGITPSCNGNGDYMPNLGFCWCRDGWYGNYCENPPPILTPQPTLVPPFDPYPTIGPNWTPDPTPSCNGRGYYVSGLGKCICNDNWTGTYCEMAPVCKGNAYMENGICKCYIGWYGENCDSRIPPS